MRTVAGSLTLLLVLSFGTTLVSFAAEPKSDHDLIQGTWKIVKATQNGKDANDTLKDAPDIVFKGDKFSIARDGKDVGGGGTFTLAPTAKPKQIDMDYGLYPGHLLRAIYELDGDTLRICGSMDGDNPKPEERPKDFAPQGHNILVLERRK